jgi:hypothetical protein
LKIAAMRGACRSKSVQEVMPSILARRWDSPVRRKLPARPLR